MPSYEYLAAELVGSQQVITSLPLVNVKYGSVLNGAGSISAAVKLEPLTTNSAAARERNRLIKDGTEPGRRCCYVLRDGTVAGAYVWWSRTYDPTTQTIELAGAELWSLLRRRVVTWQTIYSAQDQLVIARGLVTAAQAVSGGALSITVGAETSPRLRDRSYFDYEAKPVAEAVEQLAAVVDGFDFAVTATLSGGVVTRSLELSYPRRGRTSAESGHVFAWGRNVTAMSWGEDGTVMANSVIGLGQGEGLSKVRTRVTDTSAFAEGYPLLEDSISLGDVSDPSTLDGHVRASLAQRNRPVTLPRVTVLGDSDPPLGSYITGDDCHLVVPADVDPFWPAGIVTARRIHAIAVTPPNDGGVELVELTLGEAVAGT